MGTSKVAIITVLASSALLTLYFLYDDMRRISSAEKKGAVLVDWVQSISPSPTTAAALLLRHPGVLASDTSTTTSTTSAAASTTAATTFPQVKLREFTVEKWQGMTSMSVDALVERIKRDAKNNILIVQGDNRLNWLWKGDRCVGAECSFNTRPAALASLLNTRHANYNGYAYLYVDLPPQCHSGPRGLKLSAYWCTVPVAALGMRLARLAGMEYLVFLDSDVVPAAQPLKKVFDDLADAGVHWDVAAHREGFLEFWGGTAPYSKGHVNSGTIVFRVNDVAEDAVRHWWFESIKNETKFERQSHEYDVKGDKPLTLNLDELSLLFNHSGIEMASNTSEGFQFTMTPPRDPNPDPRLLRNGASQNYREYHDRFVPETCARWGMSCEKLVYSSLTKWPGDQDRFNAMLQEGKWNMHGTQSLGGSAGDFNCGTHWAYTHWCNTPHWRWRYTRLMACDFYTLPWEEYETPFKDSNKKENAFHCGLSDEQMEVWDKTVAWAQLLQNVTSISFHDTRVPEDSDTVTEMLKSLESNNFKVNLPVLNSPDDSYYKTTNLPHVELLIKRDIAGWCR